MDRNGFNLHGHFVPVEILTLILSYVEPQQSILACRMVCKAWYDIVNNEMWREKIRREAPTTFLKMKDAEMRKFIRQTPWFVFYKMFYDDFFGRNLVKNHCGQDYLDNWNLSHIGPVWDTKTADNVERPFPAHPEMQNNRTYFITRLKSSSISQTISLPANGFIEIVLDELQPKITVSTWVAGVTNAASIFKMKVFLLDVEHCPIASKIKRGLPRNRDRTRWNRVNFVFREYGRGVRYILLAYDNFYCHSDVKFTGCVVKVEKPRIEDVGWNALIERNRRPLLSSNAELNDATLPRWPWFINVQVNNKRPFDKNLMEEQKQRIVVAYFSSRQLPTDSDQFSQELIPGHWYLQILPKPWRVTFVRRKVSYYEFVHKICLRSHGLPNFVLDDLQPDIIAFDKNVTDYYDGTTFKMIVRLLDKDEKTLRAEVISGLVTEKFEDPVFIKFQNYGKGVRFITFQSRGCIDDPDIPLYLSRKRVNRFCVAVCSPTNSLEPETDQTESTLFISFKKFCVKYYVGGIFLGLVFFSFNLKTIFSVLYKIGRLTAVGVTCALLWETFPRIRIF